MVNEQYDRAKKILTEHREGHQALAEMLIRSEVIFAEDVEKIFGKRPWISRSQEILNDEQKYEQEHNAETEAQDSTTTTGNDIIEE